MRYIVLQAAILFTALALLAEPASAGPFRRAQRNNCCCCRTTAIVASGAYGAIDSEAAPAPVAPSGAVGASARAECIAEAQRIHREKVARCRAIFESSGPHYHDTAWLNNCLQQAKNEFDAKMAICRSK